MRVLDYSRRAITLAMGLSCLAGYTDAAGFLATGGVFVSFMSGNSTKLSVALATRDYTFAVLVLGVIALFVVGVILGMSVSRHTGQKRKSRVLFMVTLLLAISALAHAFQIPYVSTGFLVMAMGAENAVFQKDGQVSIGLTYMTGNLVRLGQNISAALFGGPKTDWIPYLVQWIALVLGAITGAALHQSSPDAVFWVAVIMAGTLALFARTITAESTPSVALE